MLIDRYNLMLNGFKNHMSSKHLFYVLIPISILTFTLSILFVFDISSYINYQEVEEVYHLHEAAAQPAADYPVPDAERMFTNDSAIIKKFNLDPYVLDMSQIPKQVVAGQPTLFTLNLFDKTGNVWLWHGDYHIAIRDSKGQPLAVFPNNHGHGSVIQFEYIFPKEGVYTIGIIFGQQTGSPNFMVEPHVIRAANFGVNVAPASATTTQASSATTPSSLSNNSNSKIKDISMKVESWKFTPNTIEVNKGDTVRLHLTTAQDEVALYIGHGFGIEKYNVNAFLIKGAEQTVEFVADKAGTFTFRCTSFCSSPEAALENHFNMVGKLIVH
jgi:heme/copper-type cytochrome/quinol oxidase subunit 2